MTKFSANTWVVIPTKPFEEGKRRLSAVLTREERKVLNRSFFRHTLKTALDVFRRDRILVVSRSGNALALAASMGAGTLQERGDGGLNEALGQATEQLQHGSAPFLLALSCDLPCLSAADLECLIDVGKKAPCVTVATNRDGSGTNALLVAPPGLIAYRFGDSSLRAHSEEAKAAGVEPRIVHRPGLASDIDTPADWREFRERYPDWIG